MYALFVIKIFRASRSVAQFSSAGERNSSRLYIITFCHKIIRKCIFKKKKKKRLFQDDRKKENRLNFSRENKTASAIFT